MAESQRRWDVDPLFSAAEVVQDSADRMESIYRLLLHEQTLLQGDASDAKLLTTIQFHRRDLVTTLETTKWQLEDFEKAVQFAITNDESKSRTHAISSFKQFIEALKEQLFQVEKILQSMPLEDDDKDQHAMKTNDFEIDGLAHFLHGGKFKGQIAHDSHGNLSNRVVDARGLTDEIVELEPKNIESIPEKNAKHVNHNEGNFCTWYSKPSLIGVQSLDFHHINLGESENERLHATSQTRDLEAGSCNTKGFSVKSQFSGPMFGPLSTFWFATMNKISRSFIKKRKDGDDTHEFTADNRWFRSLGPNLSPVEQVFVWIRALWRLLNSVHCSLYSTQIRVAPLVIALLFLGITAFRIV